MTLPLTPLPKKTKNKSDETVKNHIPNKHHKNKKPTKQGEFFIGLSLGVDHFFNFHLG